VDVLIEVVGGPNPKIERRWGVWLAKPKTERAALGIGPMMKWLQVGIAEMDVVGWVWCLKR
jgi:hypothetical protein